LGIHLASGDYIALCNSDDAFLPQRLSAMASRLVSSPNRFAFSAVRFVDAAGNDISAVSPFARDLVEKQSAIAGFPSVGFALTLTNVAISTGNFFFAKSLVADIGYFRKYRYCHDWDFALRALLFTEPLYVPEPLYLYRLHGANSFLGLDSAAATECPELMRRYMKAARQGHYPNQLAPCPANWPVFFDVFIAEHGYEPYLTGWESIDGVFYRPPEDLDAELGKEKVSSAS
jgi:glycosyltransferase involved in cell wall biosynthesis